jgi:hypothetical protein
MTPLRPHFVPALVLAGLSPVVLACGPSSSQGGLPGGNGGGGEDAAGGGMIDGFGSFPDGSSTFPDSSPTTDGDTQQGFVYAQSADTLYRLNPMTQEVVVVAPFTGGCSSVIDIAIDSNSNGYVTTQLALWHVDLTTAMCTMIAEGDYPNSLSFVPKGTLDPNAEALVGYKVSTYVRIDTTTGAVQNVGALSGGYVSSGDIVSVIDGGTFLTVKGGTAGCNDCLLQVDPSTGDLIQSYGSVHHMDVFGLAFWAGVAYGFDNGGDVFSIGWQNNQLVTTSIPVLNPPPMLSFWGAGSTTSAPATAEDGGGIPIQ